MKVLCMWRNPFSLAGAAILIILTLPTAARATYFTLADLKALQTSLICYQTTIDSEITFFSLRQIHLNEPKQNFKQALTELRALSLDYYSFDDEKIKKIVGHLNQLKILQTLHSVEGFHTSIPFIRSFLTVYQIFLDFAAETKTTPMRFSEYQRVHMSEHAKLSSEVQTILEHLSVEPLYSLVNETHSSQSQTATAEEIRLVNYLRLAAQTYPHFRFFLLNVLKSARSADQGFLRSVWTSSQMRNLNVNKERISTRTGLISELSEFTQESLDPERASVRGKILLGLLIQLEAQFSEKLGKSRVDIEEVKLSIFERISELQKENILVEYELGMNSPKSGNKMRFDPMKLFFRSLTELKTYLDKASDKDRENVVDGQAQLPEEILKFHSDYMRQLIHAISRHWARLQLSNEKSSLDAFETELSRLRLLPTKGMPLELLLFKGPSDLGYRVLSPDQLIAEARRVCNEDFNFYLRLNDRLRDYLNAIPEKIASSDFTLTSEDQAWIAAQSVPTRNPLNLNFIPSVLLMAKQIKIQGDPGSYLTFLGRLSKVIDEVAQNLSTDRDIVELMEDEDTEKKKTGLEKAKGAA